VRDEECVLGQLLGHRTAAAQRVDQAHDRRILALIEHVEAFQRVERRAFVVGRVGAVCDQPHVLTPIRSNHHDVTRSRRPKCLPTAPTDRRESV